MGIGKKRAKGAWALTVRIGSCLGSPHRLGKSRAKGAWALAAAAALAVAASLSLIWFVPVREDSEPAGTATRGDAATLGARESATCEDTGSGGAPSSGEGWAPSGAEAGEGGQGSAPPAAESKPPVVVDFPDPIGEEPEIPPPQGYDVIAGHWVVEMSGAGYGLSNCHLYLHEDGSITVPELYQSVFVIQQGSYTWKEGDPSFSASMLVLVKLGPSQVQVPVELALTGAVSEPLTEIAGDFSAVPASEAYAPYAQNGTFAMRR